ncbi:MAG TPA: hypothetical protein VFA26_09865, partial [Gemmataceae bacterium]|nr:hypothetical protein [Gemmataceae bacterium]
MRIGLPFLTAVTVFLTAAAPARADFVPVSSALSLEADAQADSGTPATDTQSQSQGATINPLTASVDASVLDEFGTSVEATAKGSATWTSPSAGEVVLSNVGWTASSFQETWSAALNKGLDYSYTFTSPQSGTLTFSYAVT